MDTMATYRKKFRSFEEAREFIQALGLKSNREWKRYCKGELAGRMPKPKDIPTNPNLTYKDQGWKGLGDWLGTGTIAPFNREYRPFEEAREFARTLKLRNSIEWSKYCKGELEGRVPKPEDIPAAPRNTYKDHGWQGFRDWLGTGTRGN